MKERGSVRVQARSNWGEGAASGTIPDLGEASPCLIDRGALAAGSQGRRLVATGVQVRYNHVGFAAPAKRRPGCGGA